MNNQLIQVLNFSPRNLNLLVKTTLDVKGEPVPVVALGNAYAMAAQGVNLPLALAGNKDADGAWLSAEHFDTGPDAIRYYASPMIAATAFEDLEQERDHTPMFEGRSQADMLSYLAKTSK